MSQSSPNSSSIWAKNHCFSSIKKVFHFAAASQGLHCQREACRHEEKAPHTDPYQNADGQTKANPNLGISRTRCQARTHGPSVSSSAQKPLDKLFQRSPGAYWRHFWFWFTNLLFCGDLYLILHIQGPFKNVEKNQTIIRCCLLNQRGW